MIAVHAALVLSVSLCVGDPRLPGAEFSLPAPPTAREHPEFADLLNEAEAARQQPCACRLCARGEGCKQLAAEFEATFVGMEPQVPPPAVAAFGAEVALRAERPDLALVWAEQALLDPSPPPTARRSAVHSRVEALLALEDAASEYFAHFPTDHCAWWEPQRELTPERAAVLAELERAATLLRSPLHRSEMQLRLAAAECYVGDRDRALRLFHELAQLDMRVAGPAAMAIISHPATTETQRLRQIALVSDRIYKPCELSATFEYLVAPFRKFKRDMEAAERLRRAGDVRAASVLYRRGASGYVALVEKDPKMQFADVMLYNAALSFLHAGDFGDAERAFDAILTRYPESLLVQRVLERYRERREHWEAAIRSRQQVSMNPMIL